MLDIDDLIQIKPGQYFILNDGRRVSCCSNYPLISAIIYHEDGVKQDTYQVNYREIKEIIPDNRKVKWVGD